MASPARGRFGRRGALFASIESPRGINLQICTGNYVHVTYTYTYIQLYIYVYTDVCILRYRAPSQCKCGPNVLRGLRFAPKAFTVERRARTFPALET